MQRHKGRAVNDRSEALDAAAVAAMFAVIAIKKQLVVAGSGSCQPVFSLELPRQWTGSAHQVAPGKHGLTK